MLARHILVPVDFSPYADHALAYALGLAEKLQARLTLLHVLQPMPLGAGDALTAFPPAYLQELETAAQHGLEQALQRLHTAGQQGDTALEYGVPFQRIVDTARDLQVDLIVMGTHGRTGLTHAFLGSVAEKVVRLAPCPVLVIPGKAEGPTA